MFVYKINVLEELKAAGYNTGTLRKDKLLGDIIKFIQMEDSAES